MTEAAHDIGHEQIMDTVGSGLRAVIGPREAELRALCQRKIDAAESYRDAIKAVAEKANIKPTALSRYITAMVRDKAEDYEAEEERLSLLFEELAD